MAKQEAPIDHLAHYLPEGCAHAVIDILNHYKVHLTITRKRKTVLGDYRLPSKGEPHRISVNGNLNPYSFLITLLHEVAHLEAYERYGMRIQPHGVEWGRTFSAILQHFLEKDIFPSDVKDALQKSLSNPAASSCADTRLMRALRNYDEHREHLSLVEDLSVHEQFVIPGGRVFIRGEKLRTRIKCKEVSTGRWYYFSGVYEVRRIG